MNTTTNDKYLGTLTSNEKFKAKIIKSHQSTSFNFILF